MNETILLWGFVLLIASCSIGALLRRWFLRRREELLILLGTVVGSLYVIMLGFGELRVALVIGVISLVLVVLGMLFDAVRLIRGIRARRKDHRTLN